MSISLFEKADIFAEPSPPKRRTWGLAQPFFVFVLLFLGQLLFLVPLDILGIISIDQTESYPSILYVLFGAFGTSTLLLLLWVRFFERGSLSGIGLSFAGRPMFYYLRGLGLGLLFSATIVFGIQLTGGYATESELTAGLGDLLPIFILLLAFAVQSGTEEFLFRGWLLSRLAARYSIFVGITVNALLFVLMHVFDPELLAMPASTIAIDITVSVLFSVFLSLLVIREKSVWGAAAWHTTWNWAYITFFGLPTTGISLGINPLLTDLKIADGAPLWLSGGVMGPEDSIICVIVLAAGCFWVMKKPKAEANPAA